MVEADGRLVAIVDVLKLTYATLEQINSMSTGDGEVHLREALVKAGLPAHLAAVLDEMPRKAVEVDPRRPFREPGVDRNEVFFVETGILAKYKSDGSGRRQILALRFAGDGILPGDRATDYGIQAIVRSRVLVAQQRDFDPVVDANPELARFCRERPRKRPAGP